MMIAIDKTLGSSRFKKLGMDILFYEREVPVKPIMDYLKGIEKENIAKQVEALMGVELRLQDDVVPLQKLTEELQTSKAALKRRLQNAPLKGYRLIGDDLVSENKLEDVDRRLSQLGEAKLSTALGLIQEMGIENPQEVLEDARAYQDKAQVYKNKIR